jgi:diadenosine tetraphosphate (Ap4A) HIT family hydrolase
VTDCLPCDIAAGRVTVPGGVIHERDGWVVEHCFGPLGLGTMVVKPVRHVVHVADLTVDEAAVMGALLHRTAQVVSELTGPEQVYVSLWSHGGGVPGHIHYVVQAVTRPILDVMGSYGPTLQHEMFKANVMPDPQAVERIADRARDLFAN